MFSGALHWDVSDDLALSARYDMGDQSPMRYFGVPVAQRDGFYGDFVDGNFNGDFIEEFAESNFNVCDSELSYEDDSIRLEADWQRLGQLWACRRELYQLTSDRYWKNAETYFLVGPDEIERWDPLDARPRHGAHGTADEPLVLAVRRRRSCVRGVRDERGLVRAPDELRRRRTTRAASRSTRSTSSTRTTSCPACSRTSPARRRFVLDNYSDVSQYAVFGEAQFNLERPVRDRCGAAHGRLRHALTCALRARPCMDQQVDDVTGRVGFVFDLSDDTALYAQYGTGSTHPSGYRRQRGRRSIAKRT